MAKYEIHHACGHTTTQQLYGKTSEREEKISWWESVDCPACYKKGRDTVLAEERLKEAEVAEKWLVGYPDLPALTGSKKQIAWANSIRARILAEAETLVKSLLIHKDRLDEDWILVLVDRWFDELSNQSSATWWIDHRTQTGNQVLSSRNIPAMLNMVWGGTTPKSTAQSMLRMWLDDQPEVIEYRAKIKVETEKEVVRKEVEKEAYIKDILSILDRVDWKKVVRNNEDPVVDGIIIELAIVNGERIEIDKINGNASIELDGKFLCWISQRPEVKALNKKLTDYWMNEIKSPLKTFSVGDRPGSITKNTNDPDYQYLTVQSKDGRTATIVMWGTEEWELVEINGKDIPGKMRKSSHALRIVEETKKRVK